jgi:uncharacterized protein
MKPWREVVVPHKDVLEGTFQQSEFAADITAVQRGNAPREYQDAAAFFDRTFITEGMRQLLTQVAQRLCGQGGEPVIQLQTAFGGGKTHTMLAVYHLATRQTPLSNLAGIPQLIDAAKLMDIPQARVVVLDGTALSPGQPWQAGNQTIRTLWGELAWQLGGSEAFAQVQAADQTGTSPGKALLRDLLAQYAPCVVLIDELVAWMRQFSDTQTLSGGSYDSNLSFVQALTEAVKLVPNAIVLASLPESEVESGSQRGVAALRALEKTFGRIQALWKPIATEEAFEIVRRRLFEPIQDGQTRAAVCRRFADAYIAEGARLPSETQEHRYVERLLQAYPIHPEIFDRLYEDWTTIDGFQRTRGVLKLMAKVIYRLWKDDNKDWMILPGSLPLDDSNSRNELTYYLTAGWDAVIERDIDGDRAETTELENREPRFGQIGAARRVARTLFLGSAPASVATTRATIRGLDRARILLGCLQPDQLSSIYSDALNRLADRLHYLNSSDDKTRETTRFWFDTRANLRREMEDRKRRFDDDGTGIRQKMTHSLKRAIGTNPLFEGSHLFTPHADVPDDSALRLVVLPPKKWYSREESRPAADALQEHLRQHGSQPRYRRNRLIFLAADQSTITRLYEAVRIALAWQSIVDDIKEGRLNIDLLQKNQAEKELQSADDALPRVARECFCWLLCPVQHAATDPQIDIEAFKLNTSSGAIGSEIERVCLENELVIQTWSPIHLRNTLQELYWKADKTAIGAAEFWEDTLRYLYLPRLANHSVFASTLRSGAKSRDFFGTAYGQFDDRFDGFQWGQGDIQLDDTLLLIDPAAAQAFEQQTNQPEPVADLPTVPVAPLPINTSGAKSPTGQYLDSPPLTPAPLPSAAKNFHGSAEVSAATAKMRMIELADEIIAVLYQDPNANIKITIEISAEFPTAASESIRRAVSENARTLNLKNAEWE